jgi:N-acetylmuramoyl-L-alanine amidase
MTFLLYLCKVMLCSGILLGYYWLFLRNRRFHHYNRFYLLGALIIPVLLPFLRIGIGLPSQSTVNQVVYQTVDVLTVNYGETEGLGNAAPLRERLATPENLLYLVYGLGTLTLLVVLFRSLLYIRRISQKYPYEMVNRLKLYSTSEPGTPFSFFRSVFWNEQLSFNSREGQQIFRHELFHIQQKHSSDIIIAEVVTALFWCNPFFHIIKKELKAIHEFLADQYAVSGNDRYAYAELLVLQTMQQRSPSITHRFFQNHIKRRIAMITHLNNTRYSYWRRLMVLPLTVVLFCGFALYTNKPAASFKNDGDDKVINVVIDAGHGGIDNGAASPDGKAFEKDLALQISQKIQQLAPGYHVNVIMTRSGDALPSSANSIEDGLRARLIIAEQQKADLFVSIHVSAAGKEFNDKWGGFELFIGTNEKTKPASTQLGSAILQSLGTLYTTNPVIKQRTEKGIYVLNASHCPSVLIECGFITNSKDLEFIGKSSNQEAIAKKILEGIVAYKEIQPYTTLLQDTAVIRQVSRHFNRNLRYPEKARSNGLEDVVYFSLDVNKNASLENFQLYNGTPSAAEKINDLVVVSYVEKKDQPLPITQEEKGTILKQEVKRAAEKTIDIAGQLTNAIPGRYYFRAKFKIEKDS